MKILTMRTLSEGVTDHSEIGKRDLGRNQEDRENAVKSMVSAIRKSPIASPLGPPIGLKNPTWCKWGGKWGGKWEKRKAKGVLYEKNQL